MNSEKYRLQIAGNTGRRPFLKSVLGITGGIAGGIVFGMDRVFGLDQLKPIDPDDSRISTKMVKYRGVNEMTAFSARPSRLDKYPTILLFHDNYGLDKSALDLARRLALEGFFVIAPDALAPLGGTPASRKAAAALMTKIIRDKEEVKDEKNQIDVAKNYDASIGRLRGHEFSNGRLGFLGIGRGALYAVQSAIRTPDVDAVVSYYMPMRKFRKGRKLQTEFLFHVPEQNKQIMNNLFDYENQLVDAGVRFKMNRYPDADAGFLDLFTPNRYDEDAAEDSWERTVDFLKDKLIDKRIDF